MASIKPILFLSKKLKDGTSPIGIRVTLDRKVTYFFIGKNICKVDWDIKNCKVKKSHPNFDRINAIIYKKTHELNDEILKNEYENQATTIQQLKNGVEKESKITFKQVADAYINELEKLKKYNQLNSDKPRVNHFLEFVNDDELGFDQLTINLLKQFQIFLKTERKVGERTVMNHLVVIRSICNKAIKQYSIDSKFYPFGPTKIQIRFPECIKLGLNREEVCKLEELEIDDKTFTWHAKNAWISSYYLAGVRVGDLIQLKWNDIVDDRLVYQMGKNSKVVSLKIPEKLGHILNQYKSLRGSSEYVFPFLKTSDVTGKRKLFTRIRTINYSLNYHLSLIAKELKINKKLTMHIARHTFGNIAGDKISPQMLQKLYRHSHLSTTIGYQSNFMHLDVDDALNLVLK